VAYGTPGLANVISERRVDVPRQSFTIGATTPVSSVIRPLVVAYARVLLAVVGYRDCDDGTENNNSPWMNLNPAVICERARPSGPTLFRWADRQEAAPQFSTLCVVHHVQILRDRTETIRASVKCSSLN